MKAILMLNVWKKAEMLAGHLGSRTDNGKCHNELEMSTSTVVIGSITVIA